MSLRDFLNWYLRMVCPGSADTQDHIVLFGEPGFKRNQSKGGE